VEVAAARLQATVASVEDYDLHRQSLVTGVVDGRCLYGVHKVWYQVSDERARGAGSCQFRTENGPVMPGSDQKRLP